MRGHTSKKSAGANGKEHGGHEPAKAPPLYDGADG
jgi:hypothetical protein